MVLVQGGTELGGGGDGSFLDAGRGVGEETGHLGVALL